VRLLVAWEILEQDRENLDRVLDSRKPDYALSAETDEMWRLLVSDSSATRTNRGTRELRQQSIEDQRREKGPDPSTSKTTTVDQR
jgi:hypothetical protein